MRFLEIADTVDKNNTRLYNADMTKINPRTEIYVDMDGVLVDFFKAWADIMGVKSFRDIKNIDAGLEKIKQTKDFWINLEKNLLFEKTKSVLIDDNIDALKRASEFGIKDIIGVTKPDSTRANLIINDFPTVSNISELIIN